MSDGINDSHRYGIGPKTIQPAMTPEQPQVVIPEKWMFWYRTACTNPKNIHYCQIKALIEELAAKEAEIAALQAGLIQNGSWTFRGKTPQELTAMIAQFAARQENLESATVNLKFADAALMNQERKHESQVAELRRNLEKAEQKLATAGQENSDLKAILNTPETEDFFKGIELEAAHQRYRWPSETDAGKSQADWFWLVGYLAGKCLYAAIAGDTEKALHHTISTAAALANWHRAIKGVGNMRPGIATPAEDSEAVIQKESH